MLTDKNTKRHLVAGALGQGRRDPAAQLSPQLKEDFGHQVWAAWHSPMARPKHCPPQLHQMSTAQSPLTPASPVRGQHCPSVAQARPSLTTALQGLNS